MPTEHIERNITLLQAWLDNLKESKNVDKNAHYNMGDFQIAVIDHMIAMNTELKQLITEYESAIHEYFKAYTAHLICMHMKGDKLSKKDCEKLMTGWDKKS